MCFEKKGELISFISKYFNVTEAWDAIFIQLSLLFSCHNLALIVNGNTY